MATSEILGLFQSPEQYQANQLAQFRQRSANEVQLNPFQQAAIGMRQAGYQLGGGIGGALGGTDPQLDMISRRNALLGQLDQSDPESFMKVAQAAARMGDAQFAIAIAQEGRKAASEYALIEQRTREKQGADPFEQLVRSGKYTTASLAAYKTSKNVADLELIEKPEKQIAANIKEIGVAEGTRAPVYLDVNNDLQFTYQKGADGKQARVPYIGGVDRTTAKVSASASSKGADEGAKTISELSAKRVDAAKVSAGKAMEQAGLLQELLKTPQPISGSGAPVRVGALRVFSTFGLTSPKDDEALGNADKFNALAGERVISFIKALGSNPTDTDREFARTIGPALEKGTKTNADLINFLLERARKVVKDADAIENYFYDNNYSLRGYKSPFMTDLETPKSMAPNKPVGQMTRQELLDEEARLLGNKKP
jgi:hypothetical protein